MLSPAAKIRDYVCVVVFDPVPGILFASRLCNSLNLPDDVPAPLLLFLLGS